MPDAVSPHNAAPVPSSGAHEVFSTIVKVRFAHTDPAGIIFYPRYFEMLNQVVEDWFADGLGYGFHDMVVRDGLGVPTVSVTADFMAAGELGDLIHFTLVVEQLGKSSCRVRVTGSVDGVERVVFRLTIVFAHMNDRKSKPWPEGLRTSMQNYQEN